MLICGQLSFTQILFPKMLNILILFVIIFLILSKLLDCISISQKIISYSGETNPLTKTIMCLFCINKSFGLFLL
jgi:hypothetical protein